MTAFHLECGRCEEVSEARPGAALCRKCDSPQLVRYALDELAGVDLPTAWKERPRGMWRFAEILPLRPSETPISLGEGDTPLLSLERIGEEMGLDLLVKDEGRNPTGSFKDRGLAAAVTRAVLDGVESFVIPSAGNAAAALAAYAARAGLPARVIIPKDATPGVLRRCVAFGADVLEVDGLITDCGRIAAQHAAETGSFDLSTLREPYRIEGKKTMMLEILESLEWHPPDAIIYPTGGGTGLIGIWKAMEELRHLGLISGSTRLYAVQADGCSPVVRAWREELAEAPKWTDVRTDAWGLRVPVARGDFLILRALRETGGGAVAVSDADMHRGARELASRGGVNTIIEGGATLAAAKALVRGGLLSMGERVVLLNTGNMLAY